MENKILEVFLYNKKLKFNEIEKLTKIRSNKLAFHIKKLLNKEILTKKDDYYLLSDSSEFMIPYLSSKKSTLPVILIAIEKNRKVFLYPRIKRPFKDYLSLPGGRLLIGESIKEGTRRIMKEKFNMICHFKKINSISQEHVKKNKTKIHSFLLIFVTASSKEEINYYDIEENKNKIISSDFHLLKNDSDTEIKIKTLTSKD